MDNYLDDIRHEFRESILVKEQSINLAPKIASASTEIVKRLKSGGKVILFGNGGSAADSQHIAAEFINIMYNKNRAALPAIALTTDSSVLTCISNDSDYTKVFSRQIEALASKNDIIIAISTSGNSKNVIQGIEAAKKKGVFIVGLTGQDGGQMKDMVNILLNVPSSKVSRIQEVHITIGHIICGLVEHDMFP